MLGLHCKIWNQWWPQNIWILLLNLLRRECTRPEWLKWRQTEGWWRVNRRPASGEGWNSIVIIKTKPASPLSYPPVGCILIKCMLVYFSCVYTVCVSLPFVCVYRLSVYTFRVCAPFVCVYRLSVSPICVCLPFMCVLSVRVCLPLMCVCSLYVSPFVRLYDSTVLVCLPFVNVFVFRSYMSTLLNIFLQLLKKEVQNCPFWYNSYLAWIEQVQ